MSINIKMSAAYTVVHGLMMLPTYHSRILLSSGLAVMNGGGLL